MSDEPKNGLSLPQILAGALAAASAAVASSWLGVAGTFIGAAVVSVVASIASVLYARPIERSHERLRAVASARSVAHGASAGAVAAPTMLLPKVEDDLGPAATDAQGLGAGSRTESGSGRAADGVSTEAPRAWLARRWRTVVWSAAAMLVGGLVILTGLELLANGASSVTGVGGDRKPTIVRLFDGGDDRPSDGGGGNSPGPADTDVNTPAEPRDTGTSSEPAETPRSTEPAPAEEPTQSAPTTSEPTEQPTETQPTESAPTSSAGTTPPATTATTR